MIVDSHKRKSGHLKPGVLYFAADAVLTFCNLFPFSLEGKMKKRRYTATITPFRRKELLPGNCGPDCMGCFENTRVEVGIYWVNERSYPRPKDFLNEIKRTGIVMAHKNQKKNRSGDMVRFYPEILEKQRTVLIAHQRGKVVHTPVFGGDDISYQPGIIGMVRVTDSFYMPDGKESRPNLKTFEEHGVRMVTIRKVVDVQMSLVD